MNLLIEQHRAAIAELCRQYRVRSLGLFGSAAEETFDPHRSDFDFVVEFQPMDPIPYADAYFGLAEGLEKTLGRPVDLVTVTSIRNPYLRQAIDRQRQVIYAA